MKALLCLFVGHRWITYNGLRLRGVNWYVGSMARAGLTCERCGRQR